MDKGKKIKSNYISADKGDEPYTWAVFCDGSKKLINSYICTPDGDYFLIIFYEPLYPEDEETFMLYCDPVEEVSYCYSNKREKNQKIVYKDIDYIIKTKNCENPDFDNGTVCWVYKKRPVKTENSLFVNFAKFIKRLLDKNLD